MALHLSGRGTIVTVASVDAVLPDPVVMDYSAAKAASPRRSGRPSAPTGRRSPSRPLVAR